MNNELRRIILLLVSVAACAGVKTSVGGVSNSEGMELHCSGDCRAWEVDDRVLDTAASAAEIAAAAAGANWVKLPKGQAPQENQLAKCVEFSAGMAEVCGDYLEQAVRY